MTRLEEIEAELRARWDRETLEVYADALQASGDPRGSLLAIALAGRPSTPELVRKRDALRDAWLAGFQHGEPGWMGADSGFVSIHFVTIPSLTAFLASHLAPFLLRASFAMESAECAAALDALAGRVHPWCIELDLGITSGDRDAVPIPPAIIERLARALPRLGTLRLRGPRVLHTPVPPQIEQLALEPGSLVGREPMPAVTEITFPFLPLLYEPRPELSALLHPRTFPGLRRLDFGQNEGSLGELLAVLEHLEGLDRLTSLRLPSLRCEEDVRRVRALLDRAPALVIDIARSHRPLQHLRPTGEPRIRVPAPVPCAPEDAGADDFLVVSIPEHDQVFRCSVAALAGNTELFYERFSSEQQAALTALWDRLPSLGAAWVGFPAAAMARVAETMVLTDFDTRYELEPWAEVEALLRREPCAVMISRRRWRP